MALRSVYYLTGSLDDPVYDPHLLPSADPTHGHGSQSLINLLVTGVATQNVFDGDKDLCGLTLRGIQDQAAVGFLSYLECLRWGCRY